jgi:hypothetical protein
MWALDGSGRGGGEVSEVSDRVRGVGKKLRLRQRGSASREGQPGAGRRSATCLDHVIRGLASPDKYLSRAFAITEMHVL